MADVICDMEVIDEIPSGPITKTEIRSAILSMSAGTASDIDGITLELLQAAVTTIVQVLNGLFCDMGQ